MAIYKILLNPEIPAADDAMLNEAKHLEELWG